MKNILFTIITLTTVCNHLVAQTIWTGPNVNFSKADSADWTLAENQDSITPNIVLTRQDKGMIYNYQWWQDNFGQDAFHDGSNWSGDLIADFWDEPNGATVSFTPTGGTKGLRWALLDSTGSNNQWDTAFALYGTLGDTTHFYSFHNICSMINYLDVGSIIDSVIDDFHIESSIGNGSSTDMPSLVGKNLGVWLVDDNVFLSLTFTHWGSGGNGGAVSYTRSSANPPPASVSAIEKNHVSLYPNPTKESLQVKGLATNTRYYIIDVIGNVVDTGITQDQQIISTQSLINGIYFFRVEGQTVRFIKQ